MSFTNERENVIPTHVSFDKKSSTSNKKSKKSKTEEPQVSHNYRKLKDEERKNRHYHKEEKNKNDEYRRKKRQNDTKIESDNKSEKEFTSSKSTLESEKDEDNEDISDKCSEKSEEKFPEEEHQKRNSKMPKNCNKSTQSSPIEDQYRKCTCKEKEKKEISRETDCDYKIRVKPTLRMDFCTDSNDFNNRGYPDERESNNSIAYNRRLSHREASMNILERSSELCRKKELRRDYNEQKRCGTCELCCNRRDTYHERGRFEGDNTREVFQECGENNVALMATIERQPKMKEKEKYKEREREKQKEKDRNMGKEKHKEKEKDKKKKEEKSISRNELHDLRKDLLKLQHEIDKLKVTIELIAAAMDPCKNQKSSNRTKDQCRYNFGGCIPDLSRLREKLRNCFLMRMRLCQECDNRPSPDLSRNELEKLRRDVNSIKTELEFLKKRKK